MMLLRQGDLEAADAEYNRFAQAVKKESDPTTIKGLHTLAAMMAMKKGDYEQASKHFSQTADSPFNSFYHAKCLEKAGHNDKAQKHYQKIADSKTNGLSQALFRQRAMEKL